MLPYYLFTLILLVILLLFYDSLNHKSNKTKIKQIKDSFIMPEMDKDKTKSENEELKKELDNKQPEKEKLEIKYKKITIFLAIITVILLFWQVIIPAFVHGDTKILVGDKPLTLEYPGMNYITNMLLKNQGAGQSKDVVLHIHYPAGISLHYNSINKSVTPKYDSMEIISDHECYYRWNYINSEETINIRLDFLADSSLGNYIAPIDISVRENRS